MQPGEGANPTQGHTALDSNPTSATTSGGRGPEPATGLPAGGVFLLPIWESEFINIF